MTRIPRQIMVQDRLDAFDSIKFPVSTDPAVIKKAKEHRGDGTNILRAQAGGEAVGNLTLELLSDDPEVQAIWARFYGGATLNSAMFMLRGLDEQPMNRVFWIPELVTKEGVVIDAESRTNATLETLKSLQEATAKYPDADESERTPDDLNALARRTGNASMLLGIFGSEFGQHEKNIQIATRAKGQIIDMQQAMLQVAHRLHITPTAAHLVTEVNPVGEFIRQSSADGTWPPEIAAAHRDAVHEIGHPQGF